MSVARDRARRDELYDLVFVDRGPLPPHERSWRHPSELGPTRFDVEVADTGSHLAALAAGTMAVLAVAVMVVAMTPRTAAGPVALSATTTPARAAATPASIAPSAMISTVSSSGSPLSIAVQIWRRPDASLKSFAAFPHAVTSAPQLDLDGTEIADERPDDDEMVFVRTDAVTYRMRWDDAQTIEARDGSVVFDADGDLVAYVDGGDLISLVGG